MAINLEKLKSELKRVSAIPGQNMGGSFLDNFVKMPDSDGLILMRILPATSGDIFDAFQPTRIHSINNKKLHCPRTIVGDKWQGSCVVCDYYNYLYKESKTKGKQEADALIAEAVSIKPIERFYYNVIVRSQTGQYKNGKGNELNVPLIYSAGKQVHARILRAIVGCEEEMEAALGDVTDKDTGRDLKLVKKNKKGGDGRVFPYYEDSKFLDPTPLGSPAQIEAWMESLHNLKLLRECKTQEELKRELRIHRGMEKDPNAGFDLSDLGISSEKVIVEVNPVHATAANKVEEDMGLLEDDFMKRLNNAELDI